MEPNSLELIDDINQARQAVADNPDNIELNYRLALVLIEAEEYNSALNPLRKCIELDQNNYPARFKIAHCYQILGFYERAMAVYEECLALNEKDDELYTNVGTIFYKKARYDDAIDNFLKAIEINSKNITALRNLSTLYALLENYQKALHFAQLLLHYDNINAEDYSHYALCLQKNSEAKTAIKYYLKALELEPENPFIIHNLANCYALSHNYEQAREQYQKSVELLPSESNFWFNYGEFLFNNNQHNEAASCFNQLLKLNKNDAEAWYFLARSLATDNQLEAAKAIEKAIDLEMKSEALYEFAIKLFDDIGLTDKAINIRKKLIKTNPLNKINNYEYGLHLLDQGLHLKAWEYISLAAPQKKDAAKLLLLAQSLKVLNHETKQVDCLKKILEIDPDNETVWYYFALISLEKGFTEKAFQYSKKAENFLKNEYSFWVNLCDQLLNIDKFEEAVECVNQLAAIFAYFPANWLKIIKIFNKKNKRDLLLEHFSTIMNLSKMNLDEIISMTNSLSHLDYDKEAIFILEKLFRGNPQNKELLNELCLLKIKAGDEDSVFDLIQHSDFRNDYELLNTLGDAYYKKDELEKANELYLESLKLRSDDYRVWFNLGNIAAKGLKLDEAVEYYNKSISIWSGEAKTWFNLGLIIEKQEKIDQAETHFKKAVELNNRYKKAYNSLGVIYYEQNDFQKAKHYFLRALALDQNNVNALHNLANLFEQVKQFEKADRCLNRIEELKNIE